VPHPYPQPYPQPYPHPIPPTPTPTQPNISGTKVVYLNSTGLFLSVAYSGAMSVSPDGLTWSALPSPVVAQAPPAQPSSLQCVLRPSRCVACVHGQASFVAWVCSLRVRCAWEKVPDRHWRVHVCAQAAARASPGGGWGTGSASNLS
jgi:hypothetical protein